MNRLDSESNFVDEVAASPAQAGTGTWDERITHCFDRRIVPHWSGRRLMPQTSDRLDKALLCAQ
jgi:hypothetical protein